MSKNDQIFNTRQGAAYVGSSESSLKKGRLGKGEFAGLPFYKVGRAVRYRQSDLDAFLAARRVEGVQ